ncbi:hypothetical protein V2I01_07035 [Micromonospora sp. BRA006-A]|nr:hypothetical protein [Micromonospora sp. BRA006-A]
MPVNSQVFCAMPEQLATTPPPGQGRSRLTDQRGLQALGRVHVSVQHRFDATRTEVRAASRPRLSGGR